MARGVRARIACRPARLRLPREGQVSSGAWLGVDDLFAAPGAQAARRRAESAPRAGEPRSYRIDAPKVQRLPLVLASPHSGRDYPSDLLEASRLDPRTLRRSEDCYVDQLFDFAAAIGAPLLTALFPRVYVDANREPFELDPAMFEERLPAYANTRSPRVAAGLGTIARVVAGGAEIYGAKLRFDAAKDRIDRHYWPYHEALQSLLKQTLETFGICLLLDCHSMPSANAPGAGRAIGTQAGARDAIDFVLGDCHGSACDRAFMIAAERFLSERGYRVARNQPYAGGFVTRHYGRPAEAVHALQIEINRALYMDERSLEPLPAFAALKKDLQALSLHLAEVADERAV